VSTTDQAIEAEIQAKGLTAPRVTPADIEAAIAKEFYFTGAEGLYGSAGLRENGDSEGHSNQYVKALSHVTICALVLRNGHKIIGINTGPVSTDNFDPELGRKLARQNAIDQVWPLMGYALRDRLHQGK